MNKDGNGLSGFIPTEIAKIESLQVIDLGKLAFMCTLGIFFSIKLLYLTIHENRFLINVGGNKLEGAIPSEIGQITGLKELSIDGNNLNGTIPTQIGSISTLTVLSIGTFHDECIHASL